MKRFSAKTNQLSVWALYSSPSKKNVSCRGCLALLSPGGYYTFKNVGSQPASLTELFSMFEKVNRAIAKYAEVDAASIVQLSGIFKRW